MMDFVKNVGKLRRKNKVINLDELSTLLVWAVENLGQLNELAATDKGVYFRLLDGRAGLLMMGPGGVPMAALPSEVIMT